MEKVTKKQIDQAKEYVRKVADAISSDDDIRDFVTKTESGIKTTKGNYGRYMQFLTPHAKERFFLLGVAQGLKDAGADQFGVDSAVKILIG